MPVEGPFILVNPDRCLGCHTCELACAETHTQAGSVLGVVLAVERMQPRNHVLQVDGIKLSTQCRQCEEAPCVKICPTGAVEIEDRGNLRILHNWNTTIELQACPECGKFFTPTPMAFIKDLHPETSQSWGLYPKCRQQSTARQLLSTSI